MFKCPTCFLILSNKECPVCGDTTIEMCKADHVCTCRDEISAGTKFCSLCSKPICPCGSHDVVQISRVTGYLADVAGWNAAKKQELKDRQRY